MKKIICTLAALVAAFAALAGAHPWQGARVAFLGDSITDERQLDGPNCTFWRDLQDIIGIEPYAYAVNGHKMDQIVGQADRLLADHGDSFDAIVIFVGTNDYNGGVPLGELYTYKDTVALYSGPARLPARYRTPSEDPETFYGRTNITLRTLKERWPDKQIVLMTPLHRGFARFGTKNIQPDEHFSNRIGLFVDDYVDALKKAAAEWSVPVIDLYSNAGLQPMVKGQERYFRNPSTDLLHPNTPGHRRMAMTIAAQLSSLPARFPKYIALTFDDGPNTVVTPQVLDLLEQYGIPASFFVIGRNITPESAAVMRRAHDMGCDIENHTFSHPRLPELSAEQMQDEVARTSALIEQYTGESPRFLRPPYLAMSQSLADAVGLTFIGGYCPDDWDESVTVEQRIDGVLANIRDGDVLLLHDYEANAPTVEALRTIIPELLARGFKFVTISQLFDLRWRDSRRPDHNVMYRNVY